MTNLMQSSGQQDAQKEHEQRRIRDRLAQRIHQAIAADEESNQACDHAVQLILPVASAT